MIQVSYNNGITLIYDVNDWFELRTKHRIIGEFIGNTRTSSLALPVALSPEEVILLKKLNIITLCRWDKIKCAPTDNDACNYRDYLNHMHEEQKIVLKCERKIQIENYINQIIDGRNKKMNTVSKDIVIQEELNKLPDLHKNALVSPVYTKHPNYLRGDSVDETLSEILTQTNDIKCKVFEDLWEKGYFITGGRKFGGDFLVYMGDPILFHAVYIVKCVEDINQPQSIIDIVVTGRLGNSVKKKYVIAAIENNKISYLTLNWIDSEFT